MASSGTSCPSQANSIDALQQAFNDDRYDGLVAFRGGSATDSAKALAVVTTFGDDHRAMALSALRLIGPNLRTVVNEPDDRESRRQVMLGATQAGHAFTSTGVTLVHGMTAPAWPALRHSARRFQRNGDAHRAPVVGQCGTGALPPPLERSGLPRRMRTQTPQPSSTACARSATL